MCQHYNLILFIINKIIFIFLLLPTRRVENNKEIPAKAFNSPSTPRYSTQHIYAQPYATQNHKYNILHIALSYNGPTITKIYLSGQCSVVAPTLARKFNNNKIITNRYYYFLFQSLETISRFIYYRVKSIGSNSSSLRMFLG